MTSSSKHSAGPCYSIGGFKLREHRFGVPLDHDRPGSGELELFAREVRSAEHADAELPWLVFLQGGPGFGAARPQATTGWIQRATKEYRVLLLDQRGTGRSTPLCAERLGTLPTPEAQAEHLALHRADSIVRDAECVREALLGPGSSWTVLGQSFGGFCAVTYLSRFPGSLAGAMLTGGLPPLSATSDEIYRRTYPRLIEKNRLYFERYPEDRERLALLAERLADGSLRLPGGDPFSFRRLQTLGLAFGMSDGYEDVHYVLELAFGPGTGAPGHAFMRAVENALHWDTNPIYSALHEACYAQGSATDWAAERVRGEFPGFDPPFGQAPAGAAGESSPLLTGEMVYPWFFEEVGPLKPLAAAAELLAAKDDWPALYDPAVLAENTVPTAAIVYHDDMYVDAQYSLETAAVIRGLRPWVTNEYEHNGLRADGARILDRLIETLR